MSVDRREWLVLIKVFFTGQSSGASVTAPATAAAGRLPQWDEVWRYLAVEKKFDSTSPAEAAELVQTGEWVLVDVRPSNRQSCFIFLH